MPERRCGGDRRTRLWFSLLHGSLRPRRRGPRRRRDQSIAATDWHHPQWLVISAIILLLSLSDALLTLTLLAHGAREANPVMERLVTVSPARFAVAKMSLTAVGVVVLTLLARARAFGRLPVSAILYAVLVAYLILVGYELTLLASVDFPA